MFTAIYEAAAVELAVIGNPGLAVMVGIGLPTIIGLIKGSKSMDRLEEPKTEIRIKYLKCLLSYARKWPDQGLKIRDFMSQFPIKTLK